MEKDEYDKKGEIKMTEQWDIEDDDHLEPAEESKGNGFGSVAKTNDTGGLPQSVIDLLTKYAERTNMKLPDAIKAFAEDVKKKTLVKMLRLNPMKT